MVKLVFSGLVQGSTVVIDGEQVKVEDREFDDVFLAADYADEVLEARDVLGDPVTGGAGIYVGTRLKCYRTTDGRGWQFPDLDD